MAEPVKFPEVNDVIGKPHELSNNQCEPMPLAWILTPQRGVIESAPNQHVLAFVMRWEFSDEEIQEIIKTRTVDIRVMGATLMPMWVSGFNLLELTTKLGEPIHPDLPILFTPEEVERIKEQQNPPG